MQDESCWGGVGDLNCLECDGVRALVVIVKCVSQCLPLCFWGSVRAPARSLSFGNSIDCYTGKRLRGCFVLWNTERGGILLYGVSIGMITMVMER